MSIIEEHSFASEYFVSSCEDILLSTTPQETFYEMNKYIQIHGYERQIHELQYKLVQKDVLLHYVLKQNELLKSKLEDYELGYMVWKDLTK